MDAYNNRMGPLDKALMAAPLDNPERNRLREVVRGSPAQMFNKCRRFLTLGAVYAERETFRRKMQEAPPPYHVLLARVCPVKPTCQSPAHSFESGHNCLPGMEKWARQVIQ